MITSGLSVLIALAQSAALSLAVPVPVETTSSLNLRSQVCANAPSTVAGTIFNRRSLEASSLESREAYRRNIIWCAPGTQTYIILSMAKSEASGVAIQYMLNTASSSIAAFLSEIGDGVISKGGIAWPGVGDVGFLVWNSNNHQTTWGVLRGAVASLGDYMSRNGYGAATFTIAGGLNVVGKGYVGIGQAPA